MQLEIRLQFKQYRLIRVTEHKSVLQQQPNQLGYKYITCIRAVSLSAKQFTQTHIAIIQCKIMQSAQPSYLERGGDRTITTREGG